MLMRRVLRIILPIISLCSLAAFDGARNDVLAQGDTGFGAELFTLDSRKVTFIRTFTADNASAPYTLTLTNGAGDGSSRVKKGTITLNGETILGNGLINKSFARVVLAIKPQQQNEIKIKLKGSAGSFLSISIEKTPSTLLNDPSSQERVGTPFTVAVDQASHRAYIADRSLDAILEFDIASATITRRFEGLDGDSTPGNGHTSGVSINSNTRTLVATNQGDSSADSGSLAIIALDSEAVNRIPLSGSNDRITPFLGAVNPNSNTVAFDSLYAGNKRAYFLDIASGALSMRDEEVGLLAPAVNPSTNEFIFTAGDGSPSLIVYSALAPYRRIKRIISTAKAGTDFEKVAVNPATNIAVAVNQRDGSVYLFDLAEGRQIARIPIDAGEVEYASADVAINPETNMAVVVSNFVDRVIVIDLVTKVVAMEIPLPKGTLPLGVGIDHQLNRAVITENGFGSSTRNGSILVVQLPAR